MDENKQEMIAYWQEYFSRSAFRKQLGITIDQLDEAGAVISIRVNPDIHTQSANIVHGGVIASMIDSALATAARWYLQKGQRTVTTNLQIQYLRPANSEVLTAKAVISHVGKSTIFGTCEVFAGEKVAAFGSGSFRILSIEP